MKTNEIGNESKREVKQDHIFSQRIMNLIHLFIFFFAVLYVTTKYFHVTLKIL